MNSIWCDSVRSVTFKEFQGEMQTDVLVIGGGIAGILCAYELKKAGIDCALAEADRICNGITKNTTAKITVQHGLIYSKIIQKHGKDEARLYLEAQMDAAKEYKRLCQNVQCDYKEADSYVYSRRDYGKIEREAEALNSIGCTSELTQNTELPFDDAYAVRIPNQAHFNPLKFLYEIARELPIYENTKVLEILPDGVSTNRGKIKAKKIIVCTHFPFVNKYGAYFLKLYQHRSYVIALKNDFILNGMYVDEDEKGLSFRQYGDCLLLGGGSHRTGKKGGGWRELEYYASRYYPSAKTVYRFATQDCMTLDGMPYIGQYSPKTPNLYVATGFNKWGMTSSMAAAKILVDLVQGKENRYAHIFSPSRSIFHPQLIVNAAESILGLITPTAPRCPHLGCALKYNKQEHTWDCPCHGSRFTKDGSLIDNPATDDKKL